MFDSWEGVGSWERSQPPVPTKNLVHIESIDDGPRPLPSSCSYVPSACFSRWRPALLFPDSGGPAIGDRRAPPPDQCAAKITARACSPGFIRIAPLDLASAPLARLAIGSCHRQTRNRDRLASPGISSVLGLEEPRAAGKTRVSEGGSFAR